ncbi:small G-protein [Novymonas esmeraldas]|uniref:Small G-protein n=1 Tax=Novymonas esmeraldas TaxID=1808958 RepID=A0AAW0F4V2_9TRYP
MLDYAEESIKVIVVGDGNVGKTCMLRRFVKGDFVEQYRKTIGAEFMEKDVFLRSSNTTVKLMLWDTAGQEVFNALTQAYYRGAGAAVLAFSTVDRDSFMNIAGWKQRVESVCGPIAMVLCQTKFDLSHEAVTTNEEAEKLASQLGMPLYRVSTKDDFNVTQLFEFTAQQCVEHAGEEHRGDEGDDEEEEEASEAEGKVVSGAAEGAEPTAETATALTTSPSVPPGGTSAAASPSTVASASPPVVPATPDGGGGGGGAGRSKGGKVKTRDEEGAVGKKKVTLTEPESQAPRKKKRFRCALS